MRRLLDVPSKVARRCVGPLNRKIADMFNRGEDPYGNKWAALKPSTIQRKRGDARILIRRFQLMPGTFFEAMAGAGLRLIMGPNAEWAQRGSRNREVRKVAPDQGTPAAWNDIVAEETRKEAKAAIKR